MVHNRKGRGCALVGGGWPGELGAGTFGGWFGKHTEPSLVGSELAAGTKVRKAGSHCSSPARSGLIAAVCGLAVSVDQSFIVI